MTTSITFSKNPVINFWLTRKLNLFTFLASLATFTSSFVINYIHVLLLSPSQEFTELELNLAHQISHTPDTRVLAESFIQSVLITPPLETLIFHFGLLLILLKVIDNLKAALIINSIIFAAAHFNSGIGSILSNFIAGLIYAFSFYYWNKKVNSKLKGFQAAWEIHTLHNFYYWLLTMVPASLIF